MKKYLITAFVIVFANLTQAQTQLCISTEKTTSLIFPFAIRHVDRGSQSILAQQVKEEAGKIAEQVKKEGYAKADELEKSAKNTIEKIAKKKAADKLRQETDDKANKIVAEGN